MYRSDFSACGIRRHQFGATLVELLVAIVVSLIVVGAMLIVMANSLGAGTQTIEMTKLSQEMRSAMQVITRELRRANYHAGFLACYGNVNCRATLGIDGVVKQVSVTDNGSSDCLWFWYDRPQSGTETAVTGETVAAFRRDTTNVDGTAIGTIQMTTSLTSAPNCGSDANWTDISDPRLVDIQSFDVDVSESFDETISAGGATQRVERITITMNGRLTANASVPAWLQSNTNATRTLTDHISVRNHVTAP